MSTHASRAAASIGANTNLSQLRRAILDLDPPLGVTEDLVRSAVDLEQPTPDRPPGHPWRPGADLVAEHSPIQGAGR